MNSLYLFVYKPENQSLMITTRLVFAFQGAEEYRRILADTNKIRCTVLVVTFLAMSHAFEPIMLHLLRKCLGIRKLVVGFETRMVILVHFKFTHTCIFSL